MTKIEAKTSFDLTGLMGHKERKKSKLAALMVNSAEGTTWYKTKKEFRKDPDAELITPRQLGMSKSQAAFSGEVTEAMAKT
jgi:hypothetical protein